MSDPEHLDAGIAVEGASDFHFGRPFDECPYSRVYAEWAWKAWREGWISASFFELTRGDIERRRWLTEPSKDEAA